VATKIKLMRLGKMREPHYRVVVADARTKRDGRSIETIGEYHPKNDPSVIKIDGERAAYWLGVGAQPTEAVTAILKVTGDWQKFKGEVAPEPMKVAPPKADKQSLFNAALEAQDPGQRERALQRLGDLSLFIAGFLAPAFARRLIDIDYHIAMGGRAYGTLAGSLVGGRRRVLGRVYAELAAKFQPLVDALSEIADSAHVHSQRDVLRLYELWLRTGSARARGLLARLGVVPAPAALQAH